MTTREAFRQEMEAVLLNSEHDPRDVVLDALAAVFRFADGEVGISPEMFGNLARSVAKMRSPEVQDE